MPGIESWIGNLKKHLQTLYTSIYFNSPQESIPQVSGIPSLQPEDIEWHFKNSLAENMLQQELENTIQNPRGQPIGKLSELNFHINALHAAKRAVTDIYTVNDATWRAIEGLFSDKIVGGECQGLNYLICYINDIINKQQPPQ